MSADPLLAAMDRIFSVVTETEKDLHAELIRCRDDAKSIDLLEAGEAYIEFGLPNTDRLRYAYKREDSWVCNVIEGGKSKEITVDSLRCALDTILLDRECGR